MLAAIGVAATAVVVVTSFLSYVKFKRFSATSKDSGVSKAAVA
jgi:hypothetical protein